jgi:hypothetical protein
MASNSRIYSNSSVRHVDFEEQNEVKNKNLLQAFVHINLVVCYYRLNTHKF